MNELSTVDLYSAFLDYNKSYFEELKEQKKSGSKDKILLMGLFNYIMDISNCDLRIDQPEEVVVDRLENRYYKVIDDKKLIKELADYIAFYLPLVEEDLVSYHITVEDGITCYITYLNYLSHIYGLNEYYTLDKINELYLNLLTINTNDLEIQRKSH